jgi:LytS/YehU family sensor histidine kinase
LRHVEHYLRLMQLRMPGRLQCRIDVPAHLHEVPVPPLSVLTLVENAIKHGIAPRPEGGELSIRARPQSDHWWLEVVNPLCPEAQVDGTRTGLANLRERLQLGYGESARLEVQTLSTQYRVRLCLPWRSSGERA